MAGDVDYEQHGRGYAAVRRTDPRIAAQLHSALGSAGTVVNVGAGAGSYEPVDRQVIAVEPSATMRAQRPPAAAPCVAGWAEALPLRDASVDAGLGVYTAHQWSDLQVGLRELRRVTRGPVVLLTEDPDAVRRFWLAEHCPELVDVEARRYPALDRLAAGLGGQVRVEPVPVPLDCVDGFSAAFYGRPEALLDPRVRSSQSAWTHLAPGVEERAVAALADDLASGAWDARHGHLRTQPTYEGSVRLVVATP